MNLKKLNVTLIFILTTIIFIGVLIMVRDRFWSGFVCVAYMVVLIFSLWLFDKLNTKEGLEMTNYYMTTEMYQKKVKEDQKIIDKLNAGQLTLEEAEKQLQEIWDVKKRA